MWQSHFRLKYHEIDTLPHGTFENEHDPRNPRKSYCLGNLYTVVSRKLAFLAGLDCGINLKTQEVEFLRRGWELFQAECVSVPSPLYPVSPPVLFATRKCFPLTSYARTARRSPKSV